MLKFRKGKTPDSVLAPFVLKTEGGYLIGLAADSAVGSPCSGCVERWLEDRGQSISAIPVDKLPLRADLVRKLVEKNSAHVFYEIASDGSAQKIEAVVFPHPECRCAKSNYLPPLEIPKNAQWIFSPILQIKSARFATPTGNVWLTTASGKAPKSRRWLQVVGVGTDKDASKRDALLDFIKKASVMDLEMQLESTSVVSERFPSCTPDILSRAEFQRARHQIVGSGESKEEATLDALMQYAQLRTLKKHVAETRGPLLVVGANSWIRERVPFFLIQQYDLYVLFYPNSTPSWVVGVVGLPRDRTDGAPVFTFAAHAEVHQAMEKALIKVLKQCRPRDWESTEEVDEKTSRKNNKLTLWWTNWIYRCAKIGLRELLHLEQYKPNLDVWKAYFQDGQETFTLASANSDCLPKTLFHLVHLTVPSEERESSNVQGIGTWFQFNRAFEI